MRRSHHSAPGGEVPAQTASTSPLKGPPVAIWGHRTTWLAVVVSVSALILAATYVWLRLVTPSDGAYLAPGQQAWTSSGVVVSVFEQRPRGLRPGDQVVAIDGRPMAAWEAGLLATSVPGLRWRSGQTVIYTIRRARHDVDVPVTLTSFPWLAFLGEDWSLLLYFLVFAVVGAYVFARRSADRAARVLYVSSSTLLAANLVWSFGLQIGDITGWLGFWLATAMALVVNPLCWAGFLHFVLLFPRVHPLLHRWPGLIPILYLLPVPWNLAYLTYARAQSPASLEWIAPWNPASNALTLLYGALIVGVLASNVWARLDALAQQQLRWIVLAGLVSLGGDVALWILPGIVLGRPLIGLGVLGLVLLPIPLAIAVAVLRYHVFDIDILINRTLVYGSLSAILAAIYFGSVVALQQVVRVLSGQAEQNAPVIVTSTLLIAALFQPLRRRLQRLIDRRFFRAKYDAARTLAAFGAALRQDVDLAELQGHLLGVVEETLQPSHVSLWLRAPRRES